MTHTKLQKLETLFKKNKHAYFFQNFPQDKVKALFSDRFYNLGFHNQGSLRLKSNRGEFLNSFGLDYRDLVCVKQPHSQKIVLIKSNQKGKGASNFSSAISGADGLLTKERHIPLAVFTADCLSISLYDPKNEAIGLLHAGWRGTYKGIAGKAILKMKNNFGTNAKDLLVSFSPAIRKCCYEVGSNFKKYFPENLIQHKNKLYLDIIGANLRQLISAGVKRSNIFDCKICTSCKNREFFSYRREGKAAGRMISLLMLK